MDNSQEDLYYEAKAALTEIFGINPTHEQMNEFFFNIVWPGYRLHSELLNKYQQVRRAWTTMETNLGLSHG